MKKWRASILLLSVLFVGLFLVGCKSKADRAAEKVELGQKYLTELNYTEAVASFTEAIGLDPENIPAYMGRAEAYVALEQHENAKSDYTTAIEKTQEQPYAQAQAYVGRAEVNELTTDNEDALRDYEAASEALDKVDVEKITDVTEQMLEALKIRIYNACARLNALFGRNEAAAVHYTKAIDSLERLPDDTEVLDVKATKITSYTGRADANAEQEKYEEVLPDYDALIELGEKKTAERDTLLAALSLAKSKAEDLNASEDWLDTVNHPEYAEDIQLSAGESLLKQAAELAQAEGTKAYSQVKELLSSEEAKAVMKNLLARGYQLRYYDAEGRMLSVYANETAWPDVHEEENGLVTAEVLETTTAPTEEELEAVSLDKLYVYYGGCEGRSREGEGVWYILNPAATDLTAETYTWKQDQPEGSFKKKVVAKPVQMISYTASHEYGRNSRGVMQASTATITYALNGNTVRMVENWTDDGVFSTRWDVTFYLSGGTITGVEKRNYGASFFVTPGAKVRSVMSTYLGADGKTYTDDRLNDMYAGYGSYGIGFYDAVTGKIVY